MSDLLFQATNFVSNRSDLPIIQNISDVLVSTRYEVDAYGHWAFYGDAPLIDKVHSRNLTVQAGAAIQPVFSSQGVALTNAKGSALMSDLIDNATTNVTAVYVAKTSGAGLFLMGMTLPTTGSTTENGFGAYISDATEYSKAYLNLKPAVANTAGGISNLTNNQNIGQTTPFLVAISVDKTKKTVTLYTFKAGVDSFVSSFFTSAYETANKALAVGNAYYTAAEGGARTTFAEAIIYNRALTVNELKAVARRCRARLSGKGINL